MRYYFAYALILLGVIHALFPRDSLLTKGGWKREKEQPDRKTLLWIRLGGMFCILIGLLVKYGH